MNKLLFAVGLLPMYVSFYYSQQYYLSQGFPFHLQYILAVTTVVVITAAFEFGKQHGKKVIMIFGIIVGCYSIFGSVQGQFFQKAGYENDIKKQDNISVKINDIQKEIDLLVKQANGYQKTIDEYDNKAVFVWVKYDLYKTASEQLPIINAEISILNAKKRENIDNANFSVEVKRVDGDLYSSIPNGEVLRFAMRIFFALFIEISGPFLFDLAFTLNNNKKKKKPFDRITFFELSIKNKVVPDKQYFLDNGFSDSDINKIMTICKNRGYITDIDGIMQTTNLLNINELRRNL